MTTYFKKVLLFICISLPILFTFYHGRNLINSENQRVKYHLQSEMEKVQFAIESVVQLTEILKEVIALSDGNLTEQEFYRIAKALIDNTDYTAISYLPEGINTYIYPHEVNKNVIGHNVLQDPLTAEDAIKARNEQKPTLSGPYQLIQGGLGISVRSPVFIPTKEGDGFWGYAAVILHFPSDSLNTSFTQLENEGFKVFLTGTYNSNESIVYESSDYLRKRAQYKEVMLFGNKWRMGIYRQDAQVEIFLQIMFIGIFYTSLFTTVYMLILKREKKLANIKEQLQHDKLTGAYNRKFLDDFIVNCEQNNLETKKIVLFFIDLNKFKPVNDTYGHDMGDKLLVNYVERLRWHFKKDTPIIRMGGDEFVVIVTEHYSERLVISITDRINDLSEKKFIIDDVTIQISASVGYAAYPNDGEDLETLLHKADMMMYEVKQLRKESEQRNLR